MLTLILAKKRSSKYTIARIYHYIAGYFINDDINTTNVGATSLNTIVEYLPKWIVNYSNKTIGDEEISKR